MIFDSTESVLKNICKWGKKPYEDDCSWASIRYEESKTLYVYMDSDGWLIYSSENGPWITKK